MTTLLAAIDDSAAARPVLDTAAALAPLLHCRVQAVTVTDVVAIVIGARGRPQGTRPAGHVTTELITRCDKPIVVVPPEARSGDGLHRVLVAVEGSQETSRVLVPTMRLAADAHLEVIVVHVDDEASIPLFSDQPQHETEAFAEEFLLRNCPDCGGEPRLELRIGSPAEEVLAACEATKADIVVVAWACSLEPGHARLVRHLLEHSHIPILLVPVQA